MTNLPEFQDVINQMTDEMLAEGKALDTWGRREQLDYATMRREGNAILSMLYYNGGCPTCGGEMECELAFMVTDKNGRQGSYFFAMPTDLHELLKEVFSTADRMIRSALDS